MAEGCHVHPDATIRWDRDESAGLEFGWCRRCRDVVTSRPLAAPRIVAERERVAARKTTGRIADRFTFAVVGVTFTADYPANLYRIEWAWNARAFDAIPGDPEAREGLPAILVRNPDNRNDRNAVEVHVPAAATDGLSGMVGHMPANLAARIAPELDAGTTFAAWVYGIRVAGAHEDRPGLDVYVARIHPDTTP